MKDLYTTLTSSNLVHILLLAFVLTVGTGMTTNSLINSQPTVSSISIEDSVEENFFLQEKIGNKLNQFSAVIDDVKVMFHKDRIELVSDEHGSYFFILLKNVVLEHPIGNEKISSIVSPIEDEAMASVLKANEIEKSVFKTISYKVSGSENSIELTLENNKINFKASNALPLDLQLWGNAGEIITENSKIQLQEFGKIVELGSNSQSLSKNSSNISFNKNNDQSKNLEWSITIK